MNLMIAGSIGLPTTLTQSGRLKSIKEDGLDDAQRLLVHSSTVRLRIPSLLPMARYANCTPRAGCQLRAPSRRSLPQRVMVSNEQAKQRLSLQRPPEQREDGACHRDQALLPTLRRDPILLGIYPHDLGSLPLTFLSAYYHLQPRTPPAPGSST
jgi:hypothetical protein